MRNAYKMLPGQLEYKISDLGIDGRIILKCILRNRMSGCVIDLYGSGLGQVAGCCVHGNEPMDSVKDGKFLD
jgi:hypothetical protein